MGHPLILPSLCPYSMLTILGVFWNTWHALLWPHIVEVGHSLESHGIWPSLKNTSLREWEYCRGREKGAHPAASFLTGREKQHGVGADTGRLVGASAPASPADLLCSLK